MTTIATPGASRTCPERTFVQYSTEQQAAYMLALELVAKIDAALTRKVCHYRNSDGELLSTLEEVIRAAIDGDLAAVEFAAKEREDVVPGLLGELHRQNYRKQAARRAVAA